MVPSILTTLALGIASLSSVGASLFASIISNTSLFVPGSAIVSNIFLLPDDNTAHAPGLYSGTTKVFSLTGSTTTPSAIIYDTTNSQPVCTKYGTRYIDCYQQATLTNTGACVAAGCTGAGKSYHVASITKPYSGSGVIKRVELNCGNLGKASTLYAAQVATSSAISGTNILGKKTIGSGSLVVYSTGGNLWTKDTPDLRVYAGTRLGVGSSNCTFGVWSDGYGS